jgi:hypothetical protein
MGADPHRGQRGMRTSLVVCVVEVGVVPGGSNG